MKKLKAILTALLALCLSPIIHGFGETEFKETEVLTRRTLTKEKSPYLFKHDVLIRPEGELIIEPGVELRFAPEAGITVRGILNADGTPEQKIKFVSYEPIDLKQPNRTIRLVDGPDINEGIVQLLELGRWQSVCTNSRNWTQADMQVACRQLGFQGGEWVFWYPHLNDTQQMLYQDPGMKTIQNSQLRVCRWQLAFDLLSAQRILFILIGTLCASRERQGACKRGRLFSVSPYIFFWCRSTWIKYPSSSKLEIFVFALNNHNVVRYSSSSL